MLQGVAQRADGADGFFLTQLRAFFEVLRFLFRRNAREQRLTSRQSRQHQSAVVRDQFFGQALHVHRLLTQLRQLGQCRRAVLRLDGVRNMEQIASVGHARHLADHIGVHLGRDARAGVQNRQRITHGAVGQTGDQLCAVGGQLQALFFGDIFHPVRDIFRPDAGKIIPLAAGKDGRRDLLDLGRRQNEDNMGGRFFQRFQQGVERRRGEHVHLIDDIYLIMASAGRIGRLVAEVADIIDAVVGRRIHFHHVENAAVVDALADLAFAAGVAVLRMQTVDCLGKDLRAGSLARAAHAGEQIRMAHTAGGDLVAQGRHDAALGHHVLEFLGSPLAV